MRRAGHVQRGTLYAASDGITAVEVALMRAVECPCGEYLEARNDAELLESAVQHAAEDHEGRYSEAELRTLVNTSAYDTEGASART